MQLDKDKIILKTGYRLYVDEMLMGQQTPISFEEFVEKYGKNGWHVQQAKAALTALARELPDTNFENEAADFYQQIKGLGNEN